MKRTGLQRFVDPLLDDNPVTVQVLGVCSALAVTRFLAPALTMALAVIAVMLFTSVTISALRHQIPNSVRLILEVTVIATGVIIADQVLQAFVPEIAATLSVFVGLIITNCIVLGRSEAYAMHNGVRDSAVDALGNGAGYGIVLILVATIRELWGEGTLFGIAMPAPVADTGLFVTNMLMQRPASAFFIVAMIVWLQRGWIARRDAGAGS